MKAVFSGSFDPITLGHVDIVARAAELVDEVVVGVAMNSAKNGIFSMDERVAFVKDAVADIPEDLVNIGGEGSAIAQSGLSALIILRNK